MLNDWTAFREKWEQRFAEIIEGYLGGGVSVVEGSRQLQLEDGSYVSVTVTPEEESFPGAGYWECEVVTTYRFRTADDPELISETWNGIEEAMGDGSDGDDPLRNRLASGRLQIAGGLDAITYEGTESDPGTKTLTLNATLAELSPN